MLIAINKEGDCSGLQRGMCEISVVVFFGRIQAMKQYLRSDNGAGKIPAS